MAISRPLLIALIAAVVAAVGFYATQGARQSADAPAEVAAPPSQPVEREAPAAKAKREPATRPSVAAVTATERAAASRRRREASAGVPVPVQRALSARRQVVLFFYEPGSADDRATARAVSALRGPRVAVFTSPIGRLAKYRKLIGQLGISQAPAVVIVGRNRTARVVEGYVDPATLAQDVADAR